MNGAILEYTVVAEIMKTYLNCGKEPYLFYFGDKAAMDGGSYRYLHDLSYRTYGKRYYGKEV